LSTAHPVAVHHWLTTGSKE